MSGNRLRVWQFGPDLIVASDETDALRIMRETIGDETLEDYEDETPWALDDDKRITIFEEDEGRCVTKLAREWAQDIGRGWLGGEY